MAKPTPVLIGGYNPEDHPAHGTYAILPRDGIIVISVQEGHYYQRSPGDPYIIVRQYTDHIYGGHNYSILQDVEVGPGSIDFAFKGIHIPNLVQDALGPANTSNFFTMQNGTYSLTFRDSLLIDEYELVVDNSTISIMPLDTNFTRPSHRLFWRVRPKSFALYCGTLTENSFLCDEFLDSLLSELDLEEFFYPDTGIIPFARSSQGHYYDAPARFFTYSDESVFQEAGDILERFTLSRIAGQMGVGISLRNWRNESFMSWLFLRGKMKP